MLDFGLDFALPIRPSYRQVPSGGIRREKGAYWHAKSERVIPIHNLIVPFFGCSLKNTSVPDFSDARRS